MILVLEPRAAVESWHRPGMVLRVANGVIYIQPTRGKSWSVSFILYIEACTVEFCNSPNVNDGIGNMSSYSSFFGK